LDHQECKVRDAGIAATTKALFLDLTFTMWLFFTSMSIGVSFFGFLLSARSRRWTYLLEGLFILFSIGLWIVILNSIGLLFGDIFLLSLEEEDAIVDNANQFFTRYVRLAITAIGWHKCCSKSTFFLVCKPLTISSSHAQNSWAGLFISIVLLTNWFDASLTTKYWLLCLTSSLALFGSLKALEANPDQLRETLNPSFDLYDIRRAGIVSMTSSVFSALMFVLSIVPFGRHLLWPNLLISTCLFLTWCWCVSFICFGTETLSPHTGTLWFSTWFSMIITMDLALQNCAYVMKQRMMHKEQNRANERMDQSRKHDDDDGAGDDKVMEESELQQEVPDKESPLQEVM
jgi:hypothetical protein